MMLKDKEEKEMLMLPVPVVNGVGYFDHKGGCCVALATHPEEDGFHIAFEFGGHILAVECLPQNYPAIDVVVYQRREDLDPFDLVCGVDRRELGAPRLPVCPRLSTRVGG